MSEENETAPRDAVALMRRWIDTWNRGDLDGFFDLYDVDAEVVTDPLWVEPGPFRGRAAIRAWFEGLKEAYDEDSIAMKEPVEVGELVLARLDWRTRGRTTGMETELHATSTNTIRNGQIIRQQFYFDHAEALEAVGLSE